AEPQQPILQQPQPAKKGLFQRLKKIGKKEQPQPIFPVSPAQEKTQPAQPLEIKPPDHEPVQPAQQPTIEKTGPSPEKTTPHIPKFCPNCGSGTKGRKFCGNCGAKLVE
ncbi:hypothetical protein FP804_00175, partial [archaeon]|nr:hypothetical protein [archaeon]